MSDIELLEEAVQNLRVISFVYKGSIRIVEPHLVGRNSKGNECLSAYQTGGGSGQAFRSFHLNEIEDLEVLEEEFEGPRPGYNPNDRTMDEIFFRL